MVIQKRASQGSPTEQLPMTPFGQVPESLGDEMVPKH